MPKPEPTEKKPHRLMVPLPDASAKLLRSVAKQTGISQGELVGNIEGSTLFSTAVEKILEARYREWQRAGDDLFTKPLNPEAVEKPINQRVEE